jgi:hypothetical protein
VSVARMIVTTAGGSMDVSGVALAQAEKIHIKINKLVL